MKTTFCLILSTFHFVGLAQIKVELQSGNSLTFMNANPEAFSLTTNGDSTIIKQLLFDRLDGLSFELSFEPKNIRLKYEIDFFQYTIDDNPSGSIGLTYWTDFKELGIPTLPDHYGSYKNGFRTFKFLGFESQSELANFYFKTYPELKVKSLEVQRNFLNELVTDEQFKKCCPEYIEQAKKFLSSDANSFDNFESLSLELVFKSIVMEITSSTGTQYLRINK